MHPDDLKIMWLCCECGRNFAFHSDVEDHKRQFDHSKMMMCNLASADKEPVLFARGRASLDFRLNGRDSRIIIEYEYYPSNGAINYIDVRYTDAGLQSMIERDPRMMKNIDNYLRKLLRQNGSAGVQDGDRPFTRL